MKTSLLNICLLLLFVVPTVLGGQQQRLTLRTSEVEVSVPISANWSMALPGPLVSPREVKPAQMGADTIAVYEADRQLHRNTEAIAQMYTEAGRIDTFLLHRLIFGQDYGLAVNVDGSTYVGTGDGQMQHVAGPDLMEERDNMTPPKMIIPEDTGNAMAAGPELASQNFRPSIHVAISPITELGAPKLPRNSAELTTQQTRLTRALYGDKLIEVGQREAVEITGRTYVAVPLVYERYGQRIYQWRLHRKEGDRQFLIELTASSATELEVLKEQVRQMQIKELPAS